MLDIGIRHKYDALASRFVENFKLFAKDCSKDVIDAGPVRLRK
jgi:phosphoenolpyruvate carboxykinase (ATP)